jgi:hypothetical protein
MFRIKWISIKYHDTFKSYQYHDTNLDKVTSISIKILFVKSISIMILFSSIIPNTAPSEFPPGS